MPQQSTTTPLASGTITLGHYAQEAVKLVAEFDEDPDVITKLAILVDLSEQLDDWQKLIDNVSAPLERQRQRQQAGIVGLKQYAEGAGFNSLEEMLADLGFGVSSPVQDKATTVPESATDSANAEKVHPNAKRKVFKELLIGNHDNYKRGHNGSFKGQKPHWCPIDPSGKGHDQTKFRLATEDEIAEMKALVAAELAAYKPRAKKTKDAGAPPKL